MARSSRSQEVERLNVAYRPLAQGITASEAMLQIARRFGFSHRQAYRYAQDARAMTREAESAEALIPITIKISGALEQAFRGRSHDLVRGPDARGLRVRIDERRLETAAWRGVRHRRKPPATATPYRLPRQLPTLHFSATNPEKAFGFGMDLLLQMRTWYDATQMQAWTDGIGVQRYLSAQQVARRMSNRTVLTESWPAIMIKPVSS